MKIDPYQHEKRYNKWKAKVSISGIPSISEVNSDLIIQYVYDMEHGLNTALGNKKGYLEKLDDGSFKVSESSLPLIKTGKECMYFDLPFFQHFLQELQKPRKS